VTLPRIEDALDQGEPLNDVHQYLFMETQRPILPGHLFSFTAAEPSHLPVLERLLVMWMGSQREPGTVRRLLEQVDRGALPFHEVLLRQEDGHRAFAVQGAPVADP
jgi:hypothetical protein